jgi:hypothetical protein
MEAFPICLDDPVGWAQLHNFVQILQGLLHLIQSDFAAGSLVESLGRLLDVVGVCKGFRGVFVGACGHQEVASVDVHCGVFGFNHDDLLEVHEGKPGVPDKVSTFTSI